MLTFEYVARDPKTNKQIKSTIDAQNKTSAAKIIVDKGLAPISITLNSESKSIFKRQHVSAKDRVIFFRQLSTLISAGMPLVQSLRTVIEQVKNEEFSLVLSSVIGSVEGGNAFADSLQKHPKIFNDVVVNLVAAGEASGTLDETLERIADQLEKDAEVASKVKGALIYPAIVLFVIFGVIIFMLTTVLPQVELLYKDLNKTLPFITAVMLLISKAIINFWWLGILMLVALIFFSRRYIATDNGRRMVDTLKLNVPIFGRLFRKLYMARFTRTGSTLLASGVQMLEMLRISGRAVNNTLITQAIMESADKVKGGKALSDALEGRDYIIDLVPQMIRIGEQSGSIDGMMAKAAEFYEKELDNEIKTISTTIEPVLMVVLALVAGTMVGAILLPVYGLVGQNIAI